MKQYNKEARVTLVGAGPGSSDLISVRGLKVLKQADVVLYDALTDVALLDEVADGVPKIYVGKRCGKHSFVQDQINSMIVENAFTYGHVVRLKGGDSFVFGRGSEELEYVESFGIPVAVVPGVSSAIAVPASQGIPVTKRGVSESFWVVTATTKEGGLSKDFQLAAQSSATLVILMGVRKLVEIAKEIVMYRKSYTPIAVVQNGTLPNENCITGTLNDAVHISNKMDLSCPGIIIIGDVVADHPSFFEDAIQRVVDMEL
ncbi:uroporphyrinogen-III C-methyltransferase [Muricauda sp. TY007]|uniref:uroporphyrinogen-III C-methyltransferase n=1 Tax=Allomuricauda sp. TY007 TaxID=2683200 RepID=UPI0013C20AE9|nr:uroporphyrinogen-III C-methyltransferase [Muricauda sp. TY007]NDV16709.1 uroporphyrinogen-III C-methyltransferase [Muricauda sp. TY007]